MPFISQNTEGYAQRFPTYRYPILIIKIRILRISNRILYT